MSREGIHATADVHPDAVIGAGSRVWHHVQIREGAKLGKSVILGRGVYIDAGVQVGDNCKIQNYACTFDGVVLEDGVFVGPCACFTNDLHPRAISPDGSQKAATDWTISRTLVKRGASIGANSTVVCGTTIGAWALVAAGSVVTKDIPDHGLVRGNPARLRGFVSRAGYPAKAVREPGDGDSVVTMKCTRTEETFEVSAADYRRARTGAAS